MTVKYIYPSDAPSYTETDSGCIFATRYLTEKFGLPTASSCFSCPSDSGCIYDFLESDSAGKYQRGKQVGEFVTKYFTGQLEE